MKKKQGGQLRKYMNLTKEFLSFNGIFLLCMIINSYIFEIVNISIKNEYLISAIKIILESFSTIIAIYIFIKWKEKRNILHSIRFSDKKLKSNMALATFFSFLFLVLLYLSKSVEYSGLINSKLYIEDSFLIVLVGILECSLEVATEEVLFRYTINSLLLRFLNKKSTIIISTIYYLFIHILDKGITPIVLINLALLNLLLSSVYSKYKNIWCIILPRAVFEFIFAYGFSINRMGRDEIGIVFLNRVNNTILNGGQYGAYGSIFMTIIIGVLIFILYRNKMDTIPAKAKEIL